MESVDLGRFAASFFFVVGLIFILAWLVQRFGLGQRLVARAGYTPRLAIMERLSIDPRHRLVLIRRDGREHLVMLGATHDVLIESYDAPPSADDTTKQAPAA